MTRIGRVARLVYVLAGLFAVTIVGTRGAALWRDWQGALAGASASATETAQIVEQYARRVFETSDLVADLLAQEVAERGGPTALRNDPSFHRFLGALSERIAGDYLTIVDRDGVPIAANTSFPPPTTSLADRAWFRRHLDGEDRVVGTALVSRITGEILFTYSRALRGRDRALVGVIQVALRPVLFQPAEPSDPAREGTIRGLWTLDGRPLARSGLGAAETGDGSATAPVQMTFPAASAGIWRTVGPGDARERLYAYRKLEDWGVVAAVGIPLDAALTPFRRDLFWSIGLLVAMLFALMGLVVSARAADRREQAGRDGLAEANARLRDSRDVLEANVAERTRALAAANQQLRHSEARYRVIFNASFQSVILLRPDGTVVEANDAALAVADLRQEEVVGRPLWALRWWDEEPGTIARLRDAVTRAAAGEFVRFEAEIRGVGQSRTAIDFSIKPAPDEVGELGWLVAEGRDVGALKDAQARLHEAQKMETLGQLTGGVAHDFNNLLMAVLGNLHLLRKRLPNPEPRLTRLIDGAVQGAERGAALTQRLLAFARRQELRPSAVNLARLTASMVGLLERSLEPHARVALDVPGDLPHVQVDANQLELALLNLALNARDAMPAGGVVRIDARAPSEHAASRPVDLPPGRFVRLAVTDRGTGMDAETLARATEPFFTTKGPGKGSGLGLSMVHGLAAQSGGLLAISSTQGVGTTVALWLPVSAAAVAPAPPDAPVRARPHRPVAILLVEDDPLIQAGTAAMLEDLGHRVIVAGSGAAGLEALRGEAVELVITDYAMPGMNGLEFARRTRERHPGLPILLATGFAEVPAGTGLVLPRLSKPYGQEALARALREALGTAASPASADPSAQAEPAP